MKKSNLPRYRKAQALYKEKGNHLSPEKRGHVALASLSLFFMMMGGGLVVSMFVLIVVLLIMGGAEFVAAFFDSQSNESVQDAIFWVFILTFGPGAIQGMWLWSKLMRKTDFIGSDRVKRMSGFDSY